MGHTITSQGGFDWRQSSPPLQVLKSQIPTWPPKYESAPTNSIGNTTTAATYLHSYNIVTQRQRAVTERQKLERYQCALLGEHCQFMPKLGFQNCAKVK